MNKLRLNQATLSTIHKKCFSSLSSYPISILFCLFERARTCALNSSRISEILICNQLALIENELLCHWHSGYLYRSKIYTVGAYIYFTNTSDEFENGCASGKN